MTTQLLLNIPEARKARDKGIEKAETHANAVNPDWTKEADKKFREWLSGWPSGYKFTIEQFRFSAEIQGLSKPPSGRAYGGVAVRARAEGLIKAGEKVATSSKTAHRCFATQWIKV